MRNKATTLTVMMAALALAAAGVFSSCDSTAANSEGQSGADNAATGSVYLVGVSNMT